MNNTYYNQSLPINAPSFIAFVQNGKIFNSAGQHIGYVNEEYNKAIETAKGYEKVLYDKGILTKPKSPEEINQELQDALRQTQTMMADMSAALMSLSDKVNRMEDNNARQTDGTKPSRATTRTTEGADAK